ncbi:MAG: RDD family protein [Acidobacteria bacterium]|nr:RDD family protein [Acidobacteriota bacterium]
MTVRFDEMELFKDPAEEPATARANATREEPAPKAATAHELAPAPRWRRSLAFATDASLFLALALAMSPLLNLRVDVTETVRAEWPALLAFVGFITLLSFHYFVVSWAIWGRTVGGSIFDTRVTLVDGSPIDFRNATLRWVWMLVSVATCGLGFVAGILPGGRSLADRMSNSRSLV